MDLWSIVKKVDTTNMSAETLKTFIQENNKLILFLHLFRVRYRFPYNPS